MNELIRAVSEPTGKFIGTSIPLEHLELNETKEFLKLARTLKTTLWEQFLDFKYHNSRCKKFAGDFISIDSFLFNHFEANIPIQNIAQYAISYLLVGCESALKYKISNCYDKSIDDNWVQHLVHKCKKYEVSEILNNLKVVSFNYERSFEYFFERNLNLQFGSSPEPQKNSFFDNNVIHAYGQLEKFNSLEFGGLDNDDTAKMKELYLKFDLMYFNRNKIKWAPNEHFDQILFLGFGYDNDNIDKFGLKNFDGIFKTGTGIGLSLDNIKTLMSDYQILINPRESCKEFIDKHDF